MYFTNKFPENLRTLRARYNLSLTTLAEILGLKSKVSINRMENKKAFPQYNTLVEISDFFGVLLDWLTGRSTERYNLDTVEFFKDIKRIVRPRNAF